MLCLIELVVFVLFVLVWCFVGVCLYWCVFFCFACCFVGLIVLLVCCASFVLMRVFILFVCCVDCFVCFRLLCFVVSCCV